MNETKKEDRKKERNDGRKKEMEGMGRDKIFF